MRNPLTTVVRRMIDRTETFHECRHCGTNLGAGQTSCPVCGSEAIATYEFETNP